MSSRRGSSFWSFIFGVAFGAALGAVLMHKFLTERPAPAAPTTPPPAAVPEQPDTPPTSGPAGEDSLTRILREWQLTPEDIRRQLDRAGQVIKREGGELGEHLDEATLDTRIVALIKAKFALDPKLSAWDIGVRSREGHVTLSGTVSEPDLVVRAVVLALDTHGVLDVASSLQVNAITAPATPPVER